MRSSLMKGTYGVDGHHVPTQRSFKRRYATHENVGDIGFRGLKPTATIMASLRDG
jgi:hypothetical protein